VLLLQRGRLEMAAIAITRTDLTAAELRLASGKAPDARSARRMLALALVLEGVDRKTAAETCGMDRQTLRDWVHRYNAEGLLGLTNRHYAGPPRRLSASDLSVLAELVEKGPDPERDGVVRWRRVDLQRVIEARFGVVMHERFGRQAIEGARLCQAVGAPAAPEIRSRCPRSFQNFADEVAAVIPEAARGKPVEIWFQDEARVGQQGTLTRIWAKRGTRPRAQRLPLQMGLHLRRRLSGAPRDGRSRPAARQRRDAVAASGRNRQAGRPRRTRRSRPRRRRIPCR
jgi:transposase